jgi:hypothetical protein
MALAVGSDYQRLQDRGFYGAYYDGNKTHRANLIQVANRAYVYLKKNGRSNPSPQELADFLEIELDISDEYHKLVAELSKDKGPNQNDGFWKDTFIPSVSRFLVDNEWDDIVL